MITTSRSRTKIGPLDHGRKMSLKNYEFVRTEEGYHYELSRGFITVNYVHAIILAVVRNALIVHQLAHPDDIHIILTEMAAKLLIPKWESERHPDIAVYKTRPTGPKDRTVWRTWLSELVIEIVSECSGERDYVTQREEYWTLGILEYWIVDADRTHVVVLRRGKADWIEKRLGPDDVCTTQLLPGIKLPCKTIFAAAEAAESA